MATISISNALVLVALANASWLSAQTSQPGYPFVTSTSGGIRGHVIYQTGQPIPGATIMVVSSDNRTWTTRTASLGEFRVGLLPPGLYSLHIRREPEHADIVHHLRVHAGAWLTATNEPFVGCGVGREHMLFLAGSVRNYDYCGSSVTVFTSEELQLLPLK